jgi:peptidoglycan/xylan/chitin deacetylase (PgdA/CDA1 family)
VSGLKKSIIRAGLESLYFSGAHLAMRPFVHGVGVILTLHHVRPPRRDDFQPNRLLEVTPDFFGDVIASLRRSKIDIVSLDEMHRRLTEGDFSRRFVCLTFDDGYRDVLQWAYPIMRKHETPFALYIPTSFPDRLGEMWWLALERVIAGNSRLGLYMDGRDCRFDCGNTAEKQALFEHLYWWLRSHEKEEEMRVVVRDLCVRYGVDMQAMCEDLCMTWEDLADLATDPLCTIAAHTVNHVMLHKVPLDAARAEMAMSRAVIEAAVGARPDHLSYPVGDITSAGPREYQMAAELGFKTAVTTRPGVLFPEHASRMTALPRISLNGEYQQLRYVKVLMSGAATAMWNGFKRDKAA